MRFVAIMWPPYEDPGQHLWFVVAFGSRTLAGAQIYQLCSGHSVADAYRVGTFADLLGAEISVFDWHTVDAADLLNALYAPWLLCFVWYFMSYSGGVDCYTLEYPRSVPEVYRHYHAPDIHRTCEWYRGRAYVFVAEIVRPDWALRDYYVDGPFLFDSNI